MALTPIPPRFNLTNVPFEAMHGTGRWSVQFKIWSTKWTKIARRLERDYKLMLARDNSFVKDGNKVYVLDYDYYGLAGPIQHVDRIIGNLVGALGRVWCLFSSSELLCMVPAQNVINTDGWITPRIAYIQWLFRTRRRTMAISRNKLLPAKMTQTVEITQLIASYMPP